MMLDKCVAGRKKRRREREGGREVGRERGKKGEGGKEEPCIFQEEIFYHFSVCLQSFCTPKQA